MVWQMVPLAQMENEWIIKITPDKLLEDKRKHN